MRRKRRKKEEREEIDMNASIYTVNNEDVKRAVRKKRKKKREGTYVGVPGFESVAHEAFFVKKISRGGKMCHMFGKTSRCGICHTVLSLLLRFMYIEMASCYLR